MIYFCLANIIYIFCFLLILYLWVYTVGKCRGHQGERIIFSDGSRRIPSMEEWGVPEMGVAPNGWFISWKILLKWMIFRYIPPFQESSIRGFLKWGYPEIIISWWIFHEINHPFGGSRVGTEGASIIVENFVNEAAQPGPGRQEMGLISEWGFH